MTVYQRVIACLLVCTMASASIGCTSMKTIKTAPAGAPVFGKVKAGDTVDVRTQDGRSLRFVVQQVDADSLVAPNGVRFTRTEIVRLQRKSFSPWKTAVLAGGIVGAVFLALGIAIVTDDDFGKWY